MSEISHEQALSFLEEEELQEDYGGETKEDIAFEILADIYGTNRCGSGDPVRFRKKDLLEVFKYLSTEEGFNEVYLTMDIDNMYIPDESKGEGGWISLKKTKTEEEEKD